ncbi:MAG: TIGR03808 family TAT-translocated repetitive protein [Devosia indica]
MTNRRQLLTGLATAALSMSILQRAAAQHFVEAKDFGLDAADTGDQSSKFQMAVDAAAALQQPLSLAAGTYQVSNITIGRPVTIRGAQGATLRMGPGDAILALSDCGDVVVDGLTFDGSDALGRDGTLLSITNAQRVTVQNCNFLRAAGTGIRAHNMQGRIENCALSDIADTAIHANDSGGIEILGNTIARCGNGGIRVWRSQSGPDGSRLWGNRISDIDWVAGGNGQNGNGINVFRADNVSISDNHIVNCAFSAIRLNATKNTRVTGNHCQDSGEVSIFSEFGFSGSIISDNLIDGAAAGISMTNFNDGGRLSVCQGNIVRNLLERSPNNPDTVPYGIGVEADAAVTGNVIEGVPGTGIVIGWGPYLRDVLVNDNMVRQCTIGISVSVAPGAGHALISDNVVSGSGEHAIVAAQWDEIVSQDLPADADQFSNVAVAGNSII